MVRVQWKAKSMAVWPTRISDSLSSRPGLAGLRRDQRGATALEFALVAPLFFLMVMGTTEVGLSMFAQNVMEGATFAASRLGKTGYVTSGGTQEQTIREVLNNRAGALLDTSKIVITSKVYEQFDQIGQSEPFMDANGDGVRDIGENYTDVNGNGQYDIDMGSSGLGVAGQVVVYTVTYPWQLSTPVVSALLGHDGVINLTARTVVQNEPY